jgi:hypothetical protein
MSFLGILFHMKFICQGMAGFAVIVIGAIIGFNRRDRSKPTSTYW